MTSFSEKICRGVTLVFNYRTWPFVLFAGAAGGVFAVFADYGMSADEWIHQQQGLGALKYYLTFFHDKTVLADPVMRMYGTLLDMVSVSLLWILPFDPYDTRHLLIGLVGALGVVGTSRLAGLSAGRPAAYLSAALLLLTPSYVGHSFINMKDVAMAAGYIWSLYFITKAIQQFPHFSVSTAVGLGASVGLSVSTRFAGVLPLFYASLAILWLLISYARNPEAQRPLPFVIKQLAIKALLPASGVFVFLILIAMPYLHGNPIIRFNEIVATFSHYPYGMNVLFKGKFVLSTALPMTYLPVYTLVKLPLSYSVAFVLAVPLALYFRRDRLWQRSEVLIWCLIVFAVAFPIGYAIIGRSAITDEMRYFLFIVPVLCVLSSAVLMNAYKYLRERAPLAASVGLITLFSYESVVAWRMIRLHPYEYIYYNELVKAERYEGDYWFTSFREAVKTLDEKLAAAGDSGSHTIGLCGISQPATHYLPPTINPIELKDSNGRPDFILTGTRWDCDKRYDAPSIVTVTRDDRPLAYVRDYRDINNPKASSLRLLWKACELPGQLSVDAKGCSRSAGIDSHAQGVVTFGPYMKLGSGTYKVEIEVSSPQEAGAVVGTWDVVISDPTRATNAASATAKLDALVYGRTNGIRQVLSGTVSGTASQRTRLIGTFVVSREASGATFEARTFYAGTGAFNVYFLKLEKI